MKQIVRNPYFLYSVFIGITLIGILYGNYLSKTSNNLRIWGWENITWLFIAFPFIYLLPKVQLNFISEKNDSSFIKLLIPILIGLSFGLLDLIIIESILPHPIHQSLPPYTQPFPYSIFLYFSGALEIEVFYRLIPITLVLILASRIKNGNYLNQTFWIIAVLTAIREPLEQWPSGPTWFVFYAVVSGFAMNLIQAYYFKINGFLTSLTIRLSHYFIWHILNGIIISTNLTTT